MGTEIPNRANFPLRPATVPFGAPRGASPFSASGPVVGAEASAFRPTPPVAGSQVPTPSFTPGPVAGPDAVGFRPVTPSRPGDPAGPPPSASYGPPHTGPFQRFPSPLFSTTAQAPVAPPPVRPPMGASSSPPVSLHSQPQPVFMGSPPQSINSVQSGMNVPQSSVDSPFAAPRPNFQQSSPPIRSTYPAPRGTLQSALPGFPSKQPNAAAQAPSVNSVPFPSQQGGYVAPIPPPSRPFPAQQGGFVQSPPLAAPSGFYQREQMQHPGSMPPMATAQGLAEDFSSLSLGSVPGSFDAGVDPKALPRPLDGDVEQKIFSEMYPMNCSSRYLRLTTSALPSSQSLASRWHLPLGAVVCPLAEAPEGVCTCTSCCVTFH